MMNKLCILLVISSIFLFPAGKSCADPGEKKEAVNWNKFLNANFITGNLIPICIEGCRFEMLEEHEIRIWIVKISESGIRAFSTPILTIAYSRGFCLDGSKKDMVSLVHERYRKNRYLVVLNDGSDDALVYQNSEVFNPNAFRGILRTLIIQRAIKD